MAWTKNSHSSRRNTLITLREEVAGDQDKTLTVLTDVFDSGADNRLFELFSLRIEYTAFAAAGTRNLNFEVLLPDTDIGYRQQLSSASDIIISEVKDSEVCFGTGALATGGDRNLEPGPRLVLGRNESLRIFVSGGSNAGDDMTVHIRGIAF